MLHASNPSPLGGARDVSPTLTIVLPIHNAERTLRTDVSDVLEAGAELTSSVNVLIVDDASTDDSYEAATELARDYPQVKVIRRSKREALPRTLAEIRAKIDSDIVIVHDGASRVNPNQLRLIWRQQQVLGAVRDAQNEREGVSFADLRRPSMTQPAMEAAHRRLWGFQQMDTGNAESAPETTPVEAAENLRADTASEPHRAKRGMGAIPRLPKSNVLGSITDFALGE